MIISLSNFFQSKELKLSILLSIKTVDSSIEYQTNKTHETLYQID